jgi:hypothetical protein
VYDYLNEFFRTLPHNSVVIPDQGGNLVWTSPRFDKKFRVTFEEKVKFGANLNAHQIE